MVRSLGLYYFSFLTALVVLVKADCGPNIQPFGFTCDHESWVYNGNLNLRDITKWSYVQNNIQILGNLTVFKTLELEMCTLIVDGTLILQSSLVVLKSGSHVFVNNLVLRKGGHLSIISDQTEIILDQLLNISSGLIIDDGSILEVDVGMVRFPFVPVSSHVLYGALTGEGTVRVNVLQVDIKNITVLVYDSFDYVNGITVEVNVSPQQACVSYVSELSDNALRVVYQRKCLGGPNYLVQTVVGIIVGVFVLLFVLIGCIAIYSKPIRSVLFPFRDVIPDYNLS